MDAGAATCSILLSYQLHGPSVGPAPLHLPNMDTRPIVLNMQHPGRLFIMPSVRGRLMRVYVHHSHIKMVESAVVSGNIETLTAM